ncbi:MAG: hypothetical protein ISR55_08665 [Bacteroidetes bacterium]|nr:hypothetical protein [Bacteroidota bacterium]
MKKSILYSIIIILINSNLAFTQENADKKSDTASIEKTKTGWTFGLLPAVAFDSDLGFKYGGLINFYNFGDGSTYPDYLQSIYLEISRTTKGSGVNQLFFDSEHLFKNKKIRVTADLSYLTEQALDFYGFNGAEVKFNPAFQEDGNTSYISRMYYRHARKMLRFYTDFQAYIIPEKLRWLGGLAFYNFNISTVDINKLNKGKDAADMLPDTKSLYDKYVEWGLIGADEADGGHNQFIKAGLIWDTRDIEANPGKGIWTEALLMTAPSFLGNNENAFTKLAFTHRQYFTLIKKRLTFVYRLGYQGTIQGTAPFYLQTLLISSYSPSVITEGLGGAKSLRGIMRNRVVGDDIVFGNFEFRWKFIRAVLGGQNVYLALNPFVDIGRVIAPIEVDKGLVAPGEIYANYFTANDEKFHFTYGCGLHIALNENFVLALNYGFAADKQDGDRGLYIGTNWLF